jgi:microcystin-dependent protein
MNRSTTGTFLAIFVIFLFTCIGCGSSDNDGAYVDDGSDNNDDNSYNWHDYSYGVTIGEVRLFAGVSIPDGFIAADGRKLLIREHQVLYALVGYNRDTGERDSRGGLISFYLPNIPKTWPSAAFSGNAGNWIVAETGVFPGYDYSLYSMYYWDQVFINALNGPYFLQSTSQFYTQVPDMARKLGEDIFSYEFNYFIDNVKTTDEINDYNQDIEYPLIGELRLFKADVPLPATFLKADGRILAGGHKYDALCSIIWDYYGGDWRTYRFQLPNVMAPDGYVWAIAWYGYWPYS